MNRIVWKSLLPVFGLGLFFLIAIGAEDPSRLDHPLEPKQELTEISLPEAPKPETTPPPEETKIEDPLADLAPENLSSNASLIDTGFGAGYGSGGPSFGSGSGGFGVDAGKLVGEKTSVDRAAKVLQRVAPEYPSVARNKGIAGEVLVKVRIGTSGAVEDARVEKADPPGLFEESALKAVRAWRFEPAFQKGQPIVSWLQQKIRYELN